MELPEVLLTRSGRWSQAVGCATRYVENKRPRRGRMGAASEPSGVPARPMCMKLRLVAALSVAVLAAGCGGARQVAQQSPAATQSTPSTTAGSVFYAAVSADDGAVEAVSARTGKVLRRVAAAKRDGMSVAGVSHAGRDSLLVTYSRGPACSSGVAGCGPRPGTCGAEVLQVATDSGKATLLWQVGSDQLLRSAELSPNGKSLVALASPCVPSYINDHLAVRRQSDGTCRRLLRIAASAASSPLSGTRRRALRRRPYPRCSTAVAGGRATKNASCRTHALLPATRQRWRDPLQIVSIQ